MENLVKSVRNSGAAIAAFAAFDGQEMNEEQAKAFNAGYGKAMLDINMMLNEAEERYASEQRSKAESEFQGEGSSEEPEGRTVELGK